MIISSAPLTFRGELRDLPSSSDRNMERYQEIHDGTTSTIVTSGQEDYENGVHNLSNPFEIRLLKSGRCKWCRAALDELTDEAKVVGIPYKMNVRRANDSKYFIFRIVPNTKVCGGNCLLRYAMSEPEYRKHIPLVKFMFHLVDPTRELSPAKDWDLHVRNGGPLGDSEFYSDKFEFTRIGNVVMLPTKMEYAMVPV